MKKNYALFILLIFLFLTSYTCIAQKKDSLKSVKGDSLNTALLVNYKKDFGRMEKQRLEDSIKKVVLREQLSTLKNDTEGKAVVLGQISSLEDKESQDFELKKSKIDSLRKTAKAFPVYGFFNDTLFKIYSRLGSFSAQDRALAITRRIANLGDNYTFSADSLQISESENTTELAYGETILTSISEDDALWNNTSRQELALKYKKKIAAEVTKYKAETSLVTLLKEIGMAVVLLIFLFVIVYYTLKLFKWTADKIKLQEGKLIKSFSIKDYTLLDSQKLTEAILFGNKILKWLVVLILIYISLPVLFAIFPWTNGLADTLLSYFINPIKKIATGIINYLPNLFTIIVIVVVFRYVIKLVRYLKNEVEAGKLKINGFYPDWATPTFQIVRILLYAFMFTVIFPYLPGSDSPVFKGVSVFLGVLFTFGSSGSLSNIMSGLVLTYMRAFKIGDRVKIGDITGDIIEKSLLVTRVRTIKNEIISVPNSNVMGSHTINYSSDAPEKGLIIHTTVTIGYDVPWKEMQRVLIEAALRTEHILKEPSPFVLQTSLEDFYVAYQINGYTREPGKQALIYSQLHQNIQDCANEAGIEIMSPHYRAGRDGSTITIPENYWKKPNE